MSRVLFPIGVAMLFVLVVPFSNSAASSSQFKAQFQDSDCATTIPNAV
jgi:hypothetical protein